MSEDHSNWHRPARITGAGEPSHRRRGPELPVLGLMLGDSTGIGPEQCARVLADMRLADAARLLVVGDGRVLARGARDAGVAIDWRTYATPEEVDWDAEQIPLIDLSNLDPADTPVGAVSALAGRIAGETLEAMIALALAGRIDGIVFAPLNKAALHAGGWKFNDEHQMFARMTKHEGFFGEMNVLDNKWMSRVTSHVSLRTALDQITPQRIDDALTLADATMRGAGFARPRIAVAALNPHGGENGLFGSEEIEIIAPAVARGAARGIACAGPFPADTVFIKGFGDDYDGVLTMYHDQGQIATKLKGFNRGVTVSGGLKTVFTTPAHGTAFDIAGRGVASTGALEQAVRLAAKLASSARAKKGDRE
jgi:4-hydroxythreonine-4-phosphate dehydrogenase